MIRKFALFVGLLGIGTLLCSAEPPARIDINAPGTPVISSSVIPIPDEVFAALSKMGTRDWNSQIEKRKFNASPDRSRCALMFGLAISQGFVAVQAENAAEVKRIGLAVQRLAAPLGVKSAVEGRIKIILESLGKKNWAEIKKEFDRTRQTVLETMKGMRDDDLASLVSLGGWLGGTEALAAMLKSDYSAESSDLLNQIGLLTQLKKEFNSLPASVKRDAIFKKIEKAFAELASLMKADSNGTVSLANVTQIHKETRLLVDAIYQN